MISFKKECILICIVLLGLFGCATNAQYKKQSMESYYQALQATNPHRHEILEPGSATEKEAIERYLSFYRNYTVDNIKQHMRDVYAP
ncbi:MAG: hypothetical protein P8Y09_01700, partial [Deltaproteobacteria bacterium]